MQYYIWLLVCVLKVFCYIRSKENTLTVHFAVLCTIQYVSTRQNVKLSKNSDMFLTIDYCCQFLRTGVTERNVGWNRKKKRRKKKLPFFFVFYFLSTWPMSWPLNLDTDRITMFFLQCEWDVRENLRPPFSLTHLISLAPNSRVQLYIFVVTI